MIAVDTNVLVRFLVRDDARQHRVAAALVEKANASGEPLFVSELVLCELVWVLRYSYKVRRAELAETLRLLLHSRQLRLANRELISRAVDSYEAGKGDFADYVIQEQAKHNGAATVATFDAALLAEDGFSAP